MNTENQTEATPSRDLTDGQEAMSVTFNPGQREDVADLKQKFADAWDAIDYWAEEAAKKLRAEEAGDRPMGKRISSIQRNAAMAKSQLEIAQMLAVKAVTR